MTAKKTALLCILDGFGLNPNPAANAIAMAKKPVFDSLWDTCPRTTLITHGERVGLPAGQMGNSEVGHLNIGAGRVVAQWLYRISRELKNNALAASSTYQAFLNATKLSPAIHLMGLYSDGGVHSHHEHAKLLIQRVILDYAGPIYLHLITDGRDTSPEKSLQQLPELLDLINNFPRVKIATISGRFFTMDRDKRWERVQKAYNAIALAQGQDASNILRYIEESYSNKITDEFIEPAVVNRAPMGKDDGIIFWNFREDRMREIVKALCIDPFEGFERPIPSFKRDRVLGFTDYDHTYHLPFLFEQLDIENHLGEALSGLDKTQLRVAETEKYPHVTYFLNGGIEKEYPGEKRHVVPSPRDVKTYDLKPEMSAKAVTDVVVEGIRSGLYDLVVVNLANCDMVGHTGVIEAAVKAVETVDGCLGQMIAALKENGGSGVILADHGNADQMVNYEDGTPHTAHTLHPVPFIIVPGKETFGLPHNLRANGALSDVAPTVLKLMNITQPVEMTGTSLF